MKRFFGLIVLSFYFAVSLAGEIYVYGPETPIHYPEIHVGGIKPRFTQDNQFGTKVARNSGNSNAIFPRILIIAGYDNYEKRGENGIIVQVKNIINGINSHFSTINTASPVEFLLDGVIMVKNSTEYKPTELFNIFEMEMITNDPLTQKYKVQYHYKSPPVNHYRKASAEFSKISNWIKENYPRFEGLNAHIILHMSPYHLTDDASDPRKANLVLGLAKPHEKICSSKPVVLVSDLVGDSNVVYAMAVSYALGVSHSEDKSNFPYFPGKIPVSRSKEDEWKDKVKDAVRIYQHTWSCLNTRRSEINDL